MEWVERVELQSLIDVGSPGLLAIGAAAFGQQSDGSVVQLGEGV